MTEGRTAVLCVLTGYLSWVLRVTASQETVPWGISPLPFQEQSPSPLLLHSFSKFSHSQFCSEIPGCQRTGSAKGVACSDFLFLVVLELNLGPHA